MDLEEILAIARSVGWGAAEILQSYYHSPNSESALDLDIQEQVDGPVTAADVATNRYILGRLQTELGTENFGYLSEETYKSQPTDVPVANPLVWIIDPLDGTRDFIERTGEYAVHIALVYEDRPILAVVVWPETGKLYYAMRNGGAFVETQTALGEMDTFALKVSERDRLEDFSVVVSRSHRNRRLNHLLQQLPCQKQQAVGSVGCKIATLVEQQADVYISLSGKSAPKDWDFAAPELILTEAGGKLTHLDGTSLKYNQGDVNQWGGLVASNGHCHESLCTQAEKILAELDKTGGD